MITDQTEEVVKESEVADQTASEKKEGTEKPAWLAQLPADLKADEELGNFKTIGELAKTFKELNGKVQGSIKVPGEGAKPEEVTAFYAALGRPEAAEKYEFEKPMLPDGVNLDKTREAEFRKMAFDHGLTNKQANALFKAEIDRSLSARRSALDNLKKKTEEAEAKLKADWGNEYDVKATKAESAYKKIAEKDGGMAVELKALYSTPTGKRLFAMFSERILDDSSMKGAGNKGKTNEGRGLFGYEKL